MKYLSMHEDLSILICAHHYDTTPTMAILRNRCSISSMAHSIALDRNEQLIPHHRRGEAPIFLRFNDNCYGSSNELWHDMYTALWFLYFKENQDITSYATQHNAVICAPEHRIYLANDVAYTGGRSHLLHIGNADDHAHTIARLIYHAHDAPELFLVPEVMEFITDYWLREHPGAGALREINSPLIPAI